MSLLVTALALATAAPAAQAAPAAPTAPAAHADHAKMKAMGDDKECCCKDMAKATSGNAATKPAEHSQHKQ